VTEIPEHLLKRSRDRRAAAGGASDSPGTEVATTGDTTPAEAAPAAPAATGPAARTAAAAPAEPPATPEDIQLLREIRDSLKR